MKKIFVFAAVIILSSCAGSIYGRFSPELGVPTFISIGKTTKTEVFSKLGEPLIHRDVAGREIAIYNSETSSFVFVSGSYSGHELIVRFENDVVVEVKIEQTGIGWGVFAPANANNPGTRRSGR